MDAWHDGSSGGALAGVAVSDASAAPGVVPGGQSSARLTGGCLCGGVRFEVHDPPAQAGCCHCSLCRRFSGAANAPIIAVPGARFRLTAGADLLRAFRWEDRKDWVFCSRCGSGLLTTPRWPAGAEVRVNVRMGFLDGDQAVPRVAAHIFVDSKAVWEDITDDAPQFGGRPRG